MKNYSDIVKLLITKGADVNSKGEHGFTPLFLTRRKDIAELLIENGADIHAKNNKGSTPLHVCAFSMTSATQDRDIGIAELLIVKGADVRAENNDAETPLNLATNCGFRAAARLLREAVARPPIKGTHGQLTTDYDSLLEELKTLGRNPGFMSSAFGSGFDDARHNIRAKRIGEMLNDLGGLAHMQRAVYDVRSSVGVAASEELSCIWNDIGAWRW